MIADFRSGRTLTYVVPASVINSLQKGATYLIFAKRGSNKADSIRPVGVRTPAARPAVTPAAPAAPAAPAYRR